MVEVAWAVVAKRRSTVVDRWWRGKSSSRGMYACDGKGVCRKVGGEETNLKMQGNQRRSQTKP